MSILKNMSNLIFGHQHGGEQTNKETTDMLAKRLQAPSKLNLKDSDIPLSADPLSFDYAYYPQEVSALGDGHYIKFHIATNRKSNVENIVPTSGKHSYKGATRTAAGMLGENILKDLGGFGKAAETGLDYITKNDIIDIGSDIGGLIGKYTKENFTLTPTPAMQAQYAKLFTEGPRDKFDTHNDKIIGAIVLYTPGQTKFKYESDYENADTGILGGLIGTDSFLDTISSAGLAGIAELVTSALQIISPGVTGLLGRYTGMAINPNMELAFKSVPFRPFSFSFTFAPKNQKELEQVHKIIQMFKFHMLPSLTMEEQFFISPSQFEIEYMYRENRNTYIPKIAKCVLRTMEIDYSPGEKFTTLKPDDQGASPQIIKVELQFTEMAIITKETAMVY